MDDDLLRRPLDWLLEDDSFERDELLLLPALWLRDLLLAKEALRLEELPDLPPRRDLLRETELVLLWPLELWRLAEWLLALLFEYETLWL